jgi:hypothetical protein
MKNLICTCLLLAAGAGCSKEEPVAVTPDATEAPATAEAPVAATPQAPRVVSPGTPPAVAPQAQPQPVAGVKPLEGRVDPQMTALLKRFVAQKGRMPQSILELAGATSDSFPLAPAGYLYAIDPATSEVKLVKQ